MLKALELVGFKSFADKTRFEFPPGITVVVGPNGSGKSNIVDAVKWVLGEQSVKSLRGKEMADVIFNGSSNRRTLNSAEAVLTFDNSSGTWPIDTPEIHVARRVYRSGEGEYLINGNACRLRDIRDLFSGTGVSAQAYSIIEQGKVDVMLQASPRDRRLIFEEAAGIGRFKAKKLESLRRLDRVEQNLLRLSDIVEEVENRLRMVRKQAGKAQRWRDYTCRLQDLRTQVGLTDWRKLSEQLSEQQQTLDELTGEIDQRSSRIEIIDKRVVELETEMLSLDETVRQSDQASAANREQIASCESTINHQRDRRKDFELDIQRFQNQLTALTSKTRDLGSQLEATTQDVAEAEKKHREISQEVSKLDKQLQEASTTFDDLRGRIEQRRQEHLEAVRNATQQSNEITSLETQLQTESNAFSRCQRQLGKLEAQRRTGAAELTELARKETTFSEQLSDCQTQWKSAKRRRGQLQDELKQRQSKLAQLRENWSGLTERATVLEELEKQLEGLSSGVKQVVIDARESPDGPFREVRGLLADILEVDVDKAPLIETALGEKAGYLVVGPSRAFRQLLESGHYDFEGRVGFVPTEGHRGSENTAPLDLNGRSGVVGRADTFVNTDPMYRGLAERILNKTWIVERLSDALALAPAAPGQNFVTLDGQWLSTDGTICVGPKNQAKGLISRRSELRDLKQQIDDLAGQIDESEGVVERLNEQTADVNAEVETIDQKRETLQRQTAECRRQLSAAEQRQQQHDEQHESLVDELNRARTARDGASSDLELLREQRSENESTLEQLESVIEQDQDQLAEVEQDRQKYVSDFTSAKVALAKSDQLLDSLSTRMLQFQQDHNERQRVIQENRDQLSAARENASSCDSEVLKRESEVAALYLKKDQLLQTAQEANESREKLRADRGSVQVELQTLRGEIHRLESEKHQAELSANDVRHQRDALNSKMLEDYDIDLAAIDQQPSEEDQEQREAIEEEIQGLRRKIGNIGNVNQDALEELDGLESRYEDLSTQLSDLQKAKQSVEQIIEKINDDSRRLFTETLNSVRGHFQTLFRKLFGGGHADIIIEDETDILESGLEIVARPPGKEPRSISLLSGGEKTLTCVACLLAIFRSRPSPFCILDEVDAALDEANIGRFVGVLHEFLEWTQFIVVTHSKKTMACAGTLYGVTMQESGVSKRVSVRFEDVSETGEILNTADDDETQAA